MRFCYCSEYEVQDVHHALWERSLYGNARRELLDGIDRIRPEVNFRRLQDLQDFRRNQEKLALH